MRIFAEVLKRNSVSVHTLAPAPVPAVRREKMMKNSYPTMKSSIARHGPTVFAQGVQRQICTLAQANCQG
jgi:hypothetical protein